MYQEEADSTVTHNGKEYNVNALLRKAAKLSIDDVPVMWMEWCINPSELDKDRVARADLSAPILYTIDPTYGHVPLDGAHRVAKAILLHRKTVPGRRIPTEWL